MPEPKVLIKNRSTRPLFIEGDPNWDDQVIRVSGRNLHGTHTVAKGSHATISQRGWRDTGDEQMMGVIFSEGTDVAYQLTLGQKPDLGVTEGTSYGELHVRYAVTDQTPWSMTMTFADGTPNDDLGD